MLYYNTTEFNQIRSYELSHFNDKIYSHLTTFSYIDRYEIEHYGKHTRF